jgi:hypothetical protein
VSDPGIATEASKMSDLLSAASLLLTVLGVVYGTWYAEIISTLGAAIPADQRDRVQIRRIVWAALYGKAFPLSLAALVLTAVFLPDAVTIAFSGLRSFGTLGLKALCEYNAVKAAFCLVVVLTGALAGYLVYLVCRLKKKLREIDT